jgi:Tfp pilus assembly protein PilV
VVAIGKSKKKKAKMGGRKNLAGISLLEILIAMMILALVLVGFSNVFVVSKSYMRHGRAKVSASQLGAIFLEPLHNSVNQSDWDVIGNPLIEEVNRSGGSRTIGGIVYNSTYSITNTTDIGGANFTLRRVQVNIFWNESQ